MIASVFVIKMVIPYAVHLICSTALLHDAVCAPSPPGHYSFLIYHSQVNNQGDLLFTPVFISHCCLASLSLSLFICDHTYVLYTCESFSLLTVRFHFIPRFLNPQTTNVIYIYMEHPFLMFLDHTQRRSTVCRTPLDE